eukprot:9250292-Lingulodinium_polyedra.AAC.1
MTTPKLNAHAAIPQTRRGGTMRALLPPPRGVLLATVKLRCAAAICQTLLGGYSARGARPKRRND